MAGFILVMLALIAIVFVVFYPILCPPKPGSKRHLKYRNRAQRIKRGHFKKRKTEEDDFAYVWGEKQDISPLAHDLDEEDESDDLHTTEQGDA